MAKMGRPTVDIYEKYAQGKEEFIVSTCRNGADNNTLAKALGCGKSTLSKLIRFYPEFAALVKEGKTEADLKVESSLYRRALGYEFEETTTEVVVNKDGSGTTTVVRKTKKHVPADTTAGIFWLKNRKPENWRDRHNVDGELTINSFETFLKSVNTTDEG